LTGSPCPCAKSSASPTPLPTNDLTNPAQEIAAATLIEPIQGEEGIFLADDDAWAAGESKAVC
jgi:acetylornithine/succinyldiaminopimelate/putrescine aminotransferase